MAPAAHAALLMQLRRLRKRLLEFCAMFSRGWTTTRFSEKCVFIGTLPVNKSNRQSPSSVMEGSQNRKDINELVNGGLQHISKIALRHAARDRAMVAIT